MSLNALVLHAAGYHINPTELHYDAPVKKRDIWRAKENLMRLDLLNDDWSLTKKGRFVHSLPLGAETGSMVYAASPQMLNDVIELAAIIELRGLRADYKQPHGLDKNSDMLDALKMFRSLGYNATEEDCINVNVSWKRYADVVELIQELHNRLEVLPNIGSHHASDKELVQVMLHGSVNHIFKKSLDRNIPVYTNLLHEKGRYRPDVCSAVPSKHDDHFVIADLREIPIPGENDKPKVFAQNITRVSQDALCQFFASRSDLLTDIAFERNAKNRDHFTATYCGQQSIAIPIPHNLKDKPGMTALFGREYNEFRHKTGGKQQQKSYRDDVEAENRHSKKHGKWV